MEQSEAAYEAGSFRDPSGSVLYYQGEVYRGVDDATYSVMIKLSQDGHLAALAAEKLIVETTCIEKGSVLQQKLKKIFPTYSHFLWHQKIPFISYPYEWTAGMLASAGILHLDLQMRLLRLGYSLKDATAFNVAFKGSRPVFLDLPSIEIPKRRDVWVAYGQFCRMFVFPLLLHHLRGVEIKGLFLSDLNGPTVSHTRRILGLFKSLHPAAFLDVFLQNLLYNLAKRKQGCSPSSSALLAKEGDNSRAQLVNLQRLKRKLLKISQPYESRSDWSAYELTNRYDADSEAAKIDFVKRCLAECKPASVFDVGCNTGVYSMLAIHAGCSVVSVDLDHDSVDILYRRATKEHLELLPLLVDIANPSPALGLLNTERSSFTSRANFDCVFALALVHHLLVSGRIPLPTVAALFAELTTRWLVVEFVHPQDVMFQKLLATRKNLYTNLTEEVFEEAFCVHFSICQKTTLLGGERVLYMMRRC